MKHFQAAMPVVLTALLVLGACEQRQAQGPASTPSPAVSPARAVHLRAPAEAALSDQVVGVSRRGARDHVGAAEAAREQPDQAGAVLLYAGWSWLEASTRSWDGVGEIVLLTARPEGAARAFAHWSRDTIEPPFLGAPCPAPVTGLDDCRIGVAGDRAIVVGRLDAVVFRLECPAAAAERLMAAQAAALRA